MGFKGIRKKIKGNYGEVSNLFQRSVKGVPRQILGCFKEVSRGFKKSFKGNSRKMEFDLEVYKKSSMGV